MRSGKSLLILLALALGVGGYAYYVSSQPDSSSTPAAKRDKLFPNADASKVDTVEVRNAAGETTALKKAKDDWQITAPITADADSTEVSALVSSVTAIDTARTIDEKPTSLTQYGLSPARFTVGFRQAGETTMHQLNVGNKTPTGSDTYAQVDGQPKVVLVSSYLEDSLNRGSFDLRDKTVLKFSRDAADSLTIAPPTGAPLAVAKKGSDWTITKPLEARADFGAVDGLVSRLATAKMKAIVAPGSRPPAPAKDAKDARDAKPKDAAAKPAEAKPDAKAEAAKTDKPAGSTDYSAADLKAYGLDTPQIVATVGAGSTRASLAIGGKFDDQSVYARDLSRPIIFTLDKGILDDLKKKPDDLRIKDVFEFRAFTATAVEITYGGTTYAFAKQKVDSKDSKDPNAATEVWKQTKPAAKDIDQTKITDLLNTLSNLRADTFAEKALAAGDDLTVAATFGDAASSKTEKVTLRKSGTTAQAVHPGDTGAGVIPTADLDKALATFKALVGLK